MPEHPVTVADPRAWLSFGLRLFPAVLGGYAIAVTLGMAALAGSFEVLGHTALVLLLWGLGLGFLLGFVAGTIDGVIVRYVEQEYLRIATSAANAALTALLVPIVATTEPVRGWVWGLLAVVLPALLIGVVTYRHSPEARRITG